MRDLSPALPASGAAPALKRPHAPSTLARAICPRDPRHAQALRYGCSRSQRPTRSSSRPPVAWLQPCTSSNCQPVTCACSPAPQRRRQALGGASSCCAPVCPAPVWWCVAGWWWGGVGWEGSRRDSGVRWFLGRRGVAACAQQAARYLFTCPKVVADGKRSRLSVSSSIVYNLDLARFGTLGFISIHK